MKKHTTAIALVAMSLGLTACGGGSSSGGGGGTPDNLITGEFFNSGVTGKAYPLDIAGNGSFGRHCEGQQNYFETDDGRIRVYGSTAYSQTDFRVVATFIDQHIDPVLSRFGMTWDEFTAKRQLLTSDSMEMLLKTFMAEDGTVKPALEDSFDSWSVSDASVTFPLWEAMTLEERLDMIDEINVMIQTSIDNGAYVGPNQVPSFQSSDKILACLNPSMDGGSFGEGTRHGIAMPPNSGSYRSDAGQLVKHELVHFVQENMTRTGGRAKTLPRWFAEGQAIVFSGMSYHSPSRHYDFSPVNVVSPAEESISADEAYKHYGLAYNYLDRHNSTSNMTNLMWEMRDSNPNPLNQGYGDGVFAPGFVAAFDAAMLDHNGDPLPFADYKANYHDIMNTQY